MVFMYMIEWSRPHVHYSVTISSRWYFIDMDECIRTKKKWRRENTSNRLLFWMLATILCVIAHSRAHFFLLVGYYFYSIEIYWRACIVHTRTHQPTNVNFSVKDLDKSAVRHTYTYNNCFQWILWGKQMSIIIINKNCRRKNVHLKNKSLFLMTKIMYTKIMPDQHASRFQSTTMQIYCSPPPIYESVYRNWELYFSLAK